MVQRPAPVELRLPDLVQGEICDIDGKCVDAAEDELFKLTTKGGKIAVEREVSRGMEPPAALGASAPQRSSTLTYCTRCAHGARHVQAGLAAPHFVEGSCVAGLTGRWCGPPRCLASSRRCGFCTGRPKQGQPQGRSGAQTRL